MARSAYPEGKVGYLRWRKESAVAHAALAGDILAQAGCDADTVQRVQSLVKKERIKHDPEAQLLEDAACLVFLEFEFAALRREARRGEAHRHPAQDLAEDVAAGAGGGARLEAAARRCARWSGKRSPSREIYSITRSARTSTDCGIVRPSALAVLRLITSSILVGCSIGKSPGLAPLRILST